MKKMAQISLAGTMIILGSCVVTRGAVNRPPEDHSITIALPNPSGTYCVGNNLPLASYTCMCDGVPHTAPVSGNPQVIAVGYTSGQLVTVTYKATCIHNYTTLGSIGVRMGTGTWSAASGSPVTTCYPTGGYYTDSDGVIVYFFQALIWVSEINSCTSETRPNPPTSTPGAFHYNRDPNHSC